MSAHRFHPLANLFPLLEGAEFDALAADIKANGLRETIVLAADGSILDGRNRYLACKSAGTSPRFESYRGTDPLGFVISKNLHRRHLNESQRSMVASRIANMRQGERTDLAEPSANLPKVAQVDAAAMLNVSARSVRDAKAVQDKAIPELVRAVDQGKLAVSAAAQAAKLAPEVQAKVAAEAETGRANVVRNVIKGERAALREVALAGKIAQASADLGEKRYGVIYADPPWRFEPYSRDTGLDRAADNHYPTMTASEIAALKLPAADDCVLFLWATVPMLSEALTVMAAWGFSYKSHAVWVKDRPGTGYWVRNKHELLLIGVRGEVPAPRPGYQPDSVIEAPLGKHSEKPPVFRDGIAAMFPTVPKIELFARTAAMGWDVWGAEAPDVCPAPLPASGLLEGSGSPAPEIAPVEDWPEIPEGLRRANARSSSEAVAQTNKETAA